MKLAVKYDAIENVVVPEVAVYVPPESVKSLEKEPAPLPIDTIPPDCEKAPVTVTSPDPPVNVPAERVKLLLNVIVVSPPSKVPVDCEYAPVIVTVPVVALKAPAVRSKAPDTLNVSPAANVAVASALLIITAGKVQPAMVTVCDPEPLILMVAVPPLKATPAVTAP